jgi:sulfur carrier protein ThiS adenylyltransferase
MNSQRYSRQADIVPAQRLNECAVTVAGVGAVGRQVALQLTAIGAENLTLIDFDIVEESNIASQGYLESDLGMLKTQATCKLCRQINPRINIETVNGRFQRTQTHGNCLFCCVDSIDARRHIWNSVKDTVSFFVDGRMSGEVLRVITACDGRSRRYYPQTLFNQGQAHRGRCTAKTTIYCANIAAGLMLCSFTRYLRMLPAEADIQLNLLACEMNVLN